MCMLQLSMCTLQLSMCTLPGEHVHASGEHVYAPRWACARSQVSMCTLTHQHVHALFFPNFFFTFSCSHERRDSSPVSGRNHVISSHLMSGHGRTESGRLELSRQAASGLATRARPSVLGNVHFSMCTLPVEHVHASR